MKDKIFNFLDKNFGHIWAFFVVFDFVMAGYDFRAAFSDSPWWNAILGVFMIFYGLTVLGSYKRHYEQKAERAGRKWVFDKWAESIEQQYAAVRLPKVIKTNEVLPS